MRDEKVRSRLTLIIRGMADVVRDLVWLSDAAWPASAPHPFTDQPGAWRTGSALRQRTRHAAIIKVRI